MPEGSIETQFNNMTNASQSRFDTDYIQVGRASNKPS